MPVLDPKRERAALALLLVLGLALVVALFPFASGLIGIPVLYAVFAPLHGWLAKHLHTRLASAVVVAIALCVIAVPGIGFAGLVVVQAQQIAGSILQSPLLARLSTLQLGDLDLGPRVAAAGETLVSWIGANAFRMVGTATRLVLNLTIALFGLFYLLLRPKETWEAVRHYIPFSAANTEQLRVRFRDVTTSTVIGTGLSAVIHGVLMGLGFWVTGLPDAAFWGVVTAVFSILPVLGAGLVWGPGAIALSLDHRYTAAAALVAWGLIVIGNVDYVIRPMVYRRWAHIHPLVTLVGALAGVPYFGILGLLIGPLAVSYFFEIIKMYREEYLAS